MVCLMADKVDHYNRTYRQRPLQSNEATNPAAQTASKQAMVAEKRPALVAKDAKSAAVAKETAAKPAQKSKGLLTTNKVGISDGKLEKGEDKDGMVVLIYINTFF